jgi:hypothetical protein
MTAPSSNHAQRPDWRTLYTAAILELNHSKVSQKIIEAENAVVERAKELFQDDRDNSEEKQALDDATYFLHALRSTLTFNTSASHSPGNADAMKVA